MSDSYIQNQIKLHEFKAVHVTFDCVKIDSESEHKNLKFNLNLSDLTFPDDPKKYIKSFQLDISARSNVKEEIVHIKVEFHTVFECSEAITQEFLNSEFSKVSAPAIGFPYLRAFITTLTSQAGIAPLILPSINFIQFNQERLGDKK